MSGTVSKKVSISTVDGTITGSDIEVDIDDQGRAVVRYEGSDWAEISVSEGAEIPVTVEDLIVAIESVSDERDIAGNKIPFTLK